ncbi:hypothetical protein AAHA92_04102 [Salvia divinorum]|uniref:MATH domain-containing protein n=1 Tax=Salvia divinorum TaxID=28513 RepID=A0ABD1I0L4_SALDI
MKIERFSSLSARLIGSYETRAFEAGGYTWKLIIYPDGYTGEDGYTDEDYNVSVTFSIADTSSLPVGWEVNAIFAFFIHNQVEDNYVCFRGTTSRFNAVIPRWGLSKLISKVALMDPSNGYVVDDNCVFGAEVLVIESERVSECLSLVKDAVAIKHEWEIPDFSKGVWRSEEFYVGKYKWEVKLYPKGNHSLPKNHYMSLFVVPKGIPPHQRVKAKVLMSIKTKLGDLPPVSNMLVSHWFTSSSAGRGCPEFVSLADMSAQGFLVDDCCFMETEITLQAVVLEAPEL